MWSIPVGEGAKRRTGFLFPFMVEIDAGVGRFVVAGEASSRPFSMVVGPLTTFRRRMPEVTDAGAWPLAMLRACRDHALTERERWPLWLPVGFGTGIGIYFALPIEPSIMIGAAVGLAGLACAILATRNTRTASRVLLAALSISAMGFGYAK